MQDNQPQKIVNKSQRIEYIDALRGFTMLLVVFSHIEIFSFGIEGCSTIASSAFISFRMPLFFFMSGFLSYKLSLCTSDGKALIQNSLKKIRIQILPTVIIGLTYTYIIAKMNVYDFFISPNKLGYWFTLSLLQMFLAFYFICYITHKHSIKGNFKPWITILILTAICSYIAPSIIRRIPTIENFCNITLISRTCSYFIFFIIGVIASRYREMFFNILDNRYITAIIISTFIILTYISFTFPENYITLAKFFRTDLIVSSFGIVIVFNFFRIYQQSFTQTTRLGRALQYVGKRTLDIYLLHYFLIPTLPLFGNIIKESNSMVIEIILGLGVSILVVGFCLIISNILRTSKFLEFILFGVKRK